MRLIIVKIGLLSVISKKANSYTLRCSTNDNLPTLENIFQIIPIIFSQYSLCNDIGYGNGQVRLIAIIFFRIEIIMVPLSAYRLDLHYEIAANRTRRRCLGGEYDGLFGRKTTVCT